MSHPIPTRYQRLRSRTLATLVLTAAVGTAEPLAAQSDFTGVAGGDLATKWRINDADPMAFIPSNEDRDKDPLEFGYWLQDMIARAEVAYEAGLWEDTIKYYKPLAIGITGRAISHRRLCQSYRKLGQFDTAIESCFQTLMLPMAHVDDHLRYLDAILRKPSLPEADIANVRASLDHLREHARLNPQTLPQDRLHAAHTPYYYSTDGTDVGATGVATEPAVTDNEKPATPAMAVERAARARARAEQLAKGDAPKDEPPSGEVADRVKARVQELIKEQSAEPAPAVETEGAHLLTEVEVFECRLATRVRDIAALQTCMARLRSYGMTEQSLLPFAWFEALHNQDAEQAASLVQEAEKAGVPKEALDQMREETVRAFAAGGLGTNGGDDGGGALPWLMDALPVAGMLALFAFLATRRSRGPSTS